MLNKETALRWLIFIEALDRMVRKHDYHWGNIPEPEDWIELGMPGRPPRDEDFHRMFEYVEQSIRHDCMDKLPEILLAAHDLATGE